MEVVVTILAILLYFFSGFIFTVFFKIKCEEFYDREMDIYIIPLWPIIIPIVGSMALFKTIGTVSDKFANDYIEKAKQKQKSIEELEKENEELIERVNNLLMEKNKLHGN